MADNDCSEKDKDEPAAAAAAKSSNNDEEWEEVPEVSVKTKKRARKPANKNEEEKKPKRGPGKSPEGLFSHFTVVRTDEVTRQSYCVCNYCQEDYARRLERERTIKQRSGMSLSSSQSHLKPPKEICKTTRNCSRHLKTCQNFQPSTPVGLNASVGVGGSSVASMSSTTPASAVQAQGIGHERIASLVGQGRLTSHFMRAMMPGEVALMETALIELIVDAALPFSIVERETFKRFVDTFRAGGSRSLPKRTKVASMLLQERGNAALDSMDEHKSKAVGNGHFAGIIVDTWQNIAKLHVEAAMLKLGLLTYPINASTTGSDHHGIAVAQGWEKLVKEQLDEGRLPLKYFVSDDAGQCGRARQILALRYPFMLWLRCFAHQINLMVKALLMLTLFRSVFNKATASVNAINASSSKWLPMFCNEVQAMYGKGKGFKFLPIGVTFWSSAQACFASLLRVKTACKSFVLKHATAREFPKDIADAWSDKNFWIALEEAELLIRPFCDASFLMQRECNTLAHVLLVFINLYRHIQEYASSSDMARELQNDIEARWQKEEHPIFFLALALHPSFSQLARHILRRSLSDRGNWSRGKNVLTVTRLVQAAQFYYCKHRLVSPASAHDEDEKKKELSLLAHDVQMFLLSGDNSNLQLDAYLPERDARDPVAWWNLNKAEHPELSTFACFLLGCPVQAASCERLFKDFARQHTKSRNRLDHTTVFYQTVILHDMHQSRSRSLSGENDSKVKLKNRFVKAQEYERIDQVDKISGDKSTSDVSNDEGEGGGASAADDVPLAQLSDDEADLSELIGADEGVADFLFRVLETAEESRENAETGEDHDASATIEASTDEHPYETVDEKTLPPLPDDNDPNYPQEDAKYFRRKKYVRKDKYKLSWFLPADVEVPEVIQLFDDSYKAT